MRPSFFGFRGPSSLPLSRALALLGALAWAGCEGPPPAASTPPASPPSASSPASPPSTAWALPTNTAPGEPLPSPHRAPPEEKEVEGEVLETFESAGFSYARLRVAAGTEGGPTESWVAITSAATPPAVGQRLRVVHAVEMKDFHSRSLNRTFPRIWFGERSDARAGKP